MADPRQREVELEQLTAYLDGELTESQRAEVEGRISRDPEAAQLLDELRRASHAVQSLPRAAAPADFAVRIADRLEREALLGDPEMEAGRGQRPLRWMTPLSLAAGFVLVLTAGWLLWPQVQPRVGKDTSVAVRSVAPNEVAQPAEEAETAFALKPERAVGRRKALRSPEKRESDMSFRKDDRLEEAPLALAPPSGSARAAKPLSGEAGFATDHRMAGIGRQATTTSGPTSAPTTTSAPATSQPTTRSAP
jgi:negative regulator of sigma E activity